MKRVYVAQTYPQATPPVAVTIGTADGEDLGAGELRILVDGAEIALMVADAGQGEGWCRWEGQPYPYAYARVGSQVLLWLAGHQFTFEVTDNAPSPGRVPGARDLSLVAPVPGKVGRVVVAAGAIVEAGQPLLAIESMKMEFVVQATGPGVVAKVLVVPGLQVVAGTPLVEMAPQEDPKSDSR